MLTPGGCGGTVRLNLRRSAEHLACAAQVTSGRRSPDQTPVRLGKRLACAMGRALGPVTVSRGKAGMAAHGAAQPVAPWVRVVVDTSSQKLMCSALPCALGGSRKVWLNWLSAAYCADPVPSRTL